MPVFYFWEIFSLKIAKIGKYRFKNEKYGNFGQPLNKNR